MPDALPIASYIALLLLLERTASATSTCAAGDLGCNVVDSNASAQMCYGEA
jgi:hypothetical protein